MAGSLLQCHNCPAGCVPTCRRGPCTRLDPHAVTRKEGIDRIAACTSQDLSGTGPKLAHYFLCARLDICEPQMSSRPRPLLPLVIAATERRILEQQRRIERRKAEGRSTEASEELLMAMLTSLGIHQYKLNILRRFGETRH